MTACWSTGRNSKYPYYLCSTKSCQDYRKPIRKEQMEEEFESLLLQLRPTPNLFYMAKGMFEHLWQDRQEQAQLDRNTITFEIQQIDRKVEQYLGRILEAEHSRVITAYENQISKLKEQKVAYQEKIKNCGRPLKSFDESFRTAMTFLENPNLVGGNP